MLKIKKKSKDDKSNLDEYILLNVCIESICNVCIIMNFFYMNECWFIENIVGYEWWWKWFDRNVDL